MSSFSSPLLSSSWLTSSSRGVSGVSRVVGCALGPRGGDAALRSATGSVLLTNDGSEIARHLARVDHPAAGMTLDAMERQTKTCGDGATTVAVLADAALRAAVHRVQGSSAGDDREPADSAALRTPALVAASRARRRRLLRALDAIERHWVSRGALDRWLLADKAQVVLHPAQAHTNTQINQLMRGVVARLVRTLLGQKLSPTAVEVLGSRVVDLVFESHPSDSPPSASSLHTVCSLLLADFPFVRCAGVPFSESQALHGLVFPARVVSPGLVAPLHDARTLVLHCDIHPAPTSHEATVGRLRIETSSAKQIMDFLKAGEQFAAAWVSRFQREGVRLVLSARRIHDATLGLLTAAGIAVVHGLDEFDTRRIAKYGGAAPISSLEAYESRELPIGELAAVTQILVAGQHLLHVETRATTMPSTNGDETRRYAKRIRGHTLLLCGASEGMCRQYEGLLRRCLRMLADWTASCEARHIEQLQLHHRAAHVSSPATPSAVPLYIVGGGGSVELSLLLFCEAHSRRRFPVTSSAHILLPPESAQVQSSSESDFPAAFGVLGEGLSRLLQTLLDNGGMPPSNAAAEHVERRRATPWFKVVPHLRIIHDQSGLRNLGFGFVDVQSPPPYTPLHHSLHTTVPLTADELLARRLAVGQSEVALLPLLPSVFALADTLALPSPLVESPSMKSHSIATALALMRAILRVEGVVLVRSVPRDVGLRGGIAPLNTPASRDRRRVRARDPWYEEEMEEHHDQHNSDEESEDSGVESE